MNRMEAAHVQIDEGAKICDKLKKMYFPNASWPSCRDKVADKFTQLKKATRNLYYISQREDKRIEFENELKFLQALSKYSEQDIRDVLE